MRSKIVLHAVTIYRPLTQTNKLKFDFCHKMQCKMRKMTKLRQKLQVSHLDVIRALRYLSNHATLFGSSRNAPPQESL